MWREFSLVGDKIGERWVLRLEESEIKLDKKTKLEKYYLKKILIYSIKFYEENFSAIKMQKNAG
ncbi:hypothetical protein C943_01944 [Mariniradius saccharolyticus AK6]|uniref:Uncharacterized protein n=1 Tax=Mariniradius saccharolyticus AK6 TaxID=1239962 RepID=M7XAJ5_9BACT|nr:hypothetical protein C943_01944 [Mariniradius saccharolyticus AK6]